METVALAGSRLRLLQRNDTLSYRKIVGACQTPCNFEPLLTPLFTNPVLIIAQQYPCSNLYSSFCVLSSTFRLKSRAFLMF